MNLIKSASKILLVVAALGLTVVGCERRAGDMGPGASGTSSSSGESSGAMGSSGSSGSSESDTSR